MNKNSILFSDSPRCYLIGVPVPSPAEGQNSVLLETVSSHFDLPEGLYEFLESLSVCSTENSMLEVFASKGIGKTEFEKYIEIGRVVRIPPIILNNDFERIFGSLAVVPLNGNTFAEVDDINVKFFHQASPDDYVEIPRLALDFLKSSSGDVSFHELAKALSDGSDELYSEMIVQVLNHLPRLVDRRLAGLIRVNSNG